MKKREFNVVGYGIRPELLTKLEVVGKCEEGHELWKVRAGNGVVSLACFVCDAEYEEEK